MVASRRCEREYLSASIIHQIWPLGWVGPNEGGDLVVGTEVRRKINFFRADPSIDEATGQIKAFEPAPIINRLRSLSEIEKQLERTDGNLTFCRIFDGSRYPRLRLGTVRMAEIPEGFDRRDSSDFTFDMAEEQGISENSHMVFFPNNILGLEYNYRGPGIGRLEEYLRKKAPISETRVSFNPLLNKDFEEQLERLEDVREVRVRVSNRQVEGANSQEINPEEDDPYKVLENMKDFGEAGEYEIAWKSRSRSRESIDRRFFSVARSYLRRYDTEDNSAMLVIRGHDEEGHLQRINVLNERIVFEETAFKLRPGDRAVISDSAFQAIERAYRDNREVIERAAALYI